VRIETTRERAFGAVLAHAPEYGDAELRELGSGLDHRAFLIRDLVVRLADPASPAAVLAEAELLQLLNMRVSVPVPTPVFADPVRGALGYRLLPGRPLLDREPPRGLATRLGRLLRDLHDVDPSELTECAPVDPALPDDWLDDLTGPSQLLQIVHTQRPRPAQDLVLTHADLGAEHILEHDGELSGIINWSDAAVTDPALDFPRLYRDFGPTFLDQALLAYGTDSADFRGRITFFARCAALEDIAYGQVSGRAAYLRAAQHSLSWLFPPQGGF
jgi:aminoglycoside phosphotransferase (APT) family kinase protein